MVYSGSSNHCGLLMYNPAGNDSVHIGADNGYAWGEIRAGRSLGLVSGSTFYIQAQTRSFQITQLSSASGQQALRVTGVNVSAAVLHLKMPASHATNALEIVTSASAFSAGINQNGVPGFCGITPPTTQPNSTGETVGFTAGSGTAVNDDSTFTGNVGSTAYRISDIVKHLKNLGLIAQ